MSAPHPFDRPSPDDGSADDGGPSGTGRREPGARVRAAALGLLDVGIYVVDGAGELVQADGRVDQLLGPGSGAAPPPPLRRVHPDDRPLLARARERRRAGRPTDVAYRLTGGPRGVRWMQERSRRLRGEEGGPAGASVVVVWDRSEEARTERAEAASRFLVRASALLASTLRPREALRRLADLAVPEVADLCAVHLLDDEGGLEPLATVHTGDDEAVARARAAYDPARHRDGVILEALGRGEPVLADGRGAVLRRCMAGHPGREAVEALGLRSVVSLPLSARGQRFGALTLAFTDASGRRYGPADLPLLEELARRAGVAVDNGRLLEAAQRARREAERAGRVRTDFLAAMSHELRTPLNAIVGYADLLEGGVVGDVTAEQRTQLQRIDASAWHLLDLIDDVLQLSGIETGAAGVETRVVDAGALVGEAVEAVGERARAKGLELRTEAPGDPVEIRTDPERVRRILLNLLTNAVAYTETGLVVVSWDRQGTEARIHVRDTGPGIPRDRRERVFEPFTPRETRGGPEGGAGLGLAVARRLARILGGEVELESEPGQGSVFTLRLPVAGPP